ncbi:MAG: fumarylacetoacetate hydrolase family protein [archaeon]|nr:fumarylacetoacetate hydrolase family protein [archaeon]
MRLVTFSNGFQNRLGVLINSAVIDVKSACEEVLDHGIASIFSDMRSFLSSGDLGLKLAKDLIETVKLSSDSGRDTKSRRSYRSLIALDNQIHLRAPISDPQKILCPAVNYMSHSNESQVNPPKEPYFFGKFANTIIGPDDPILIPDISNKIDYEVELAAIIGKRGKNISKDQVYDYIVGYTILNDISFRDLQGWPKPASSLGMNWYKGKGLDGACPIGPCIVTKDEISTPYPLKIMLRVNGKTRQDSSTEMQIFQLPDLVSYVSQGITLEAGDIVSTGTPAGVASTTGEFLKDGDIVEAEIEKIGVLRNRILSEES